MTALTEALTLSLSRCGCLCYFNSTVQYHLAENLSMFCSQTSNISFRKRTHADTHGCTHTCTNTDTLFAFEYEKFLCEKCVQFIQPVENDRRGVKRKKRIWRKRKKERDRQDERKTEKDTHIPRYTDKYRERCQQREKKKIAKRARMQILIYKHSH